MLGYLPAELAVVGSELQVMYMNERFPVKVAAIEGSVFDPDDSSPQGLSRASHDLEIGPRPHVAGGDMSLRILVCVKVLAAVRRTLRSTCGRTSLAAVVGVS